MADRAPSAAEVDTALATLGLERAMSWDEMRHAYRRRLRDHHPDVDPNPDATAHTAALTAAWTVVARATSGGTRELRISPDPQTETPATASQAQTPAVRPMTLAAPAGDVFVHLLEAASAMGEVSYMDPEAGLLQLLLDNGDPAGAQLLIAVDRDVTPTAVSFTLDSASAESAPDVTAVVEQLAGHLASIPR